jgi:hypothetical protein
MTIDVKVTLYYIPVLFSRTIDCQIRKSYNVEKFLIGYFIQSCGIEKQQF